MSESSVTDNPTPMVAVDLDGDVAIATICRETLSDEDNLEELVNLINDAAQASPKHQLVLDVSRMQHITSAALGKWIAIHRSLARSGGQMILCGAGPELKEILSATRLIKLFDIADDRSSAIAMMNS